MDKPIKIGVISLLAESEDIYGFIDKVAERGQISQARADTIKEDLRNNLSYEVWCDSFILKAKAYEVDLNKRLKELNAGINRISRRLKVTL